MAGRWVDVFRFALFCGRDRRTVGASHRPLARAPSFFTGVTTVLTAFLHCRWMAAGALLTGLLLCGVGCRFLSVLQETPNLPRQEDQAGTPQQFSYRLAPYVFLADFEIDRKLPIFQDLAHLRDQVYQELRLTSSSQVVLVYLFANEDKYEQFMKVKYPDLPKRRAFFVAQPRALGGGEDLQVYTFWGDRIQQDLRHELTHALLHSVLKDVPLWLDEGLAEYFEVPPAWNGVNSTHLEHLCASDKGPFRPSLERLESLREVQQMRPTEYREAWAWVHWMLRGEPKARPILLAYLHELRSNGQPGPLRPRLQAVVPNLEAALQQYVERLHTGNFRPATAQR